MPLPWQRSKQDVYLIAGLGNPGVKYARTRHNAGFEVVEKLSGLLRILPQRQKFDALLGEGRVGDKRVILAQPMTYMNESGRAISAIARFYKIPPERILVIYDDIDLPEGKVRIRAKGGPGTHNGMRSIVGALGTQNFPRVRIGVGAPPPQWNLVDYVLGGYPPASRAEMELAFVAGAEAARCFVENGIDIAMNRYNTR